MRYVACIAAALMACGSESPDLSGSWLGSLEGQCAPIVSLTITENDRGDLSGTGRIAIPVSCGLSGQNYTVAGSHDGSGVSIVLTPAPGSGTAATSLVSGTVRDADTIDAMLDGAAVTLSRQDQ